jgi:pectin methylesterase-like acyl-CoA thioesterase
MPEFTVAGDGSGDFRTIQSALDHAPANLTERVVIQVRRGEYPEIVRVKPGQNRITLRGEDRRETVIAFTNNELLHSQSSNRAMMLVEGDEFILENITLRNTTPKGGSQAEALKVDADRVIVRDADFFSFQDTLMLNGRVFVTNCLVAGDVDFIWGYGTAFIERSEIRALNPGYNVQARNANGSLGYVFVDCALTAAPGVAGHFLARTGKGDDHVAYIDCGMGSHIAAAGWSGQNTGLGWSEYHSMDLTGHPVDVGQRVESRQLSDRQASHWRDPAFVLRGWNPRGRPQ